MTNIPRRRAKITGTWVFFESRNTELATVSWHPRFKQHYRTKAQAKRLWEEKGRILLTGETPKRKEAPTRRSESPLQAEMRI